MKKTLLSVIALLAFTFVTFAQTDVFVEQNCGFTSPARGIRYVKAVNTNVVWAAAYDGLNASGPCSDFTRTTNGGTTWTAGTIPGISSLSIAMIDATDAQTAWVVTFPPTGTSTVDGIYKTSNGGTTWTRQATATFSNSASFPNCIHMFNANEGWCMGDPINSDFEIYTTIDGGTVWTPVPGAQIDNPVSGEFGVIGYTSSIGDTSWFGTNKGRIYRSVDKGHNWTAAQIPGWSGKYVTPVFKDGMHGIAQTRQALPELAALAETSDGGVTWTIVASSEDSIYNADLAYVPGTPNTYIATGSDSENSLAGVQYSFDGGHSWTDMPNTQQPLNQIQYLAEAWINPYTGWVGSFADMTTGETGGMWKFTDCLAPVAPDFETADTALAFGGTANFTNLTPGGANFHWAFEGGTPATSNLETPPSIHYNTAGTFDVSLTMDFGSNFFNPDTTITKIGYIRVGDVGINETTKAKVTVGPNPATDFVNVTSTIAIKEVQVYNLLGQIVYNQKVNNNSITINTASLQSGLYNVKVVMADGSVIRKVVID